MSGKYAPLPGPITPPPPPLAAAATTTATAGLPSTPAFAFAFSITLARLSPPLSVTPTRPFPRFFFYVLGGSTVFVGCFAVFVYFQHPAKGKIGAGDCAICVFAWADFVGYVKEIRNLY